MLHLPGPQAVVPVKCESDFRCACSRIRQTQLRTSVEKSRFDRSAAPWLYEDRLAHQDSRSESRFSCDALLQFFFYLSLLSGFISSHCATAQQSHAQRRSQRLTVIETVSE